MSYLFAGYLVIWTILFAYLIFLTRTQSKMTADLRSLVELLEKRDRDSS